jgi:ribosomal protein L40E
MQQPNPTTCGNCGTENPTDAEVCQGCGLPLTRSGGEELRERDEAQIEDGFFGVDDDEGEPDQPGVPDNGPSRRI